MNERIVLTVDPDLAEDLAIELATIAGLDVQLANQPPVSEATYSTSTSEEPLHSLDWTTMETLIVTVTSSATAALTFAQALVDFTRSRKERKATRGTAEPTITINNNFIVRGDTEDGPRMLAAYLSDNEVREMVLGSGQSSTHEDDR